LDYEFDRRGEYKTIFDVRTDDGRQFATDFPISVISAPTNWLFWLGLAVLALLSFGTIYGYFNSWQKDGATVGVAVRQTAPVALGALVFFGLGTAALAYFSPPRETREIAALPPASEAGAAGTAAGKAGAGAGDLTSALTIPKESQLLFGIRTATVEERQIVSGLRTTGTVRARPDARAVVSPPVSGRIKLNGNVQIGAAVGRGQTIGSVEQILGAPEQAALEGQRIGLRTAALEQQARATEQQSLAAQARTRLTQAQRELQRSRNLLEVGAAPRRRVEEAETAVKLAQQEVSSAESQARVAQQQVKLSNESVARVDPVRTFSLTAPVTGIISNINAVTGQQVEAGAEIFNIVNLTTVILEAQVFERDLAAVLESGRATYTSPVLGDEVYAIGQEGDGRLVSIGQSVDPQTRTVPVIFEVPNPSNRLREGVFVEITLDTSGGNRVLTVPKQSVVTEQGQTFVFVFDGGERFERRPVRLGAEGQDYFEVQQGLAAGERVVTEGIYQLRSTQPA
jgi:RND family efflux transporter MFP subunit